MVVALPLFFLSTFVGFIVGIHDKYCLKFTLFSAKVYQFQEGNMTMWKQGNMQFLQVLISNNCQVFCSLFLNRELTLIFYNVVVT